MSSQRQFILPVAFLIFAQVGCQSMPLPKSTSQNDRRLETLSRRLRERESEVELLRAENLILHKKLSGQGGRSAATAIPVMASEKEYWDYLMQSQLSKDADRLEVATDLYLRRFPQSPKADDALYFVAPSHLKAGRWVQSLATFDRILKEYPKGDRQASALLGKAVTYKKMNVPETARSLLQELIDEHPQSREAFQARAELKVLQEQPSKVLSKKTSEN